VIIDHSGDDLSSRPLNSNDGCKQMVFPASQLVGTRNQIYFSQVTTQKINTVLCKSLDCTGCFLAHSAVSYTCIYCWLAWNCMWLCLWLCVLCVSYCQ